jgi:hypothetical protein
MYVEAESPRSSRAVVVVVVGRVVAGKKEDGSAICGRSGSIPSSRRVGREDSRVLWRERAEGGVSAGDGVDLHG